MDALIDDEVPPGPLYHYTSAQGFFGIVKKKSLWLTHIRYLNDSAEFYHAVEEAIDHLDDATVTRDSFQEKLADTLRRRLRTLPPAEYFVGSFSQSGDLLSQWRSYSNEASGFSLGFDYAELAPHLKRQRFTLRRCMYDPKEKAALMQRILELVVERTAGDRDDAHVERVADEFIEAFMRLAPLFKDESFREELEWRLFIGPLSMTHPRIQFRKGSTMIIPYFDFKLISKEHPMHLSSVIVGPNSLKELSRASAEAYLLKNGISCPVLLSQIPFRQW